MADGPLADATPSDDPPRDPPRSSRVVRELLLIVAIALVAAFVLRTFVFQVSSIPSGSMRPTLQPGDRVLVCRICTTIGGVQPGDVVVFTGPDGREYIKRVAGLPGDVVELHDGTLFVNGRAVAEPYLAAQEDPAAYGPIRVPNGMLFVLGDNRAHSGDSRFPPPRGVGLVPEDQVVGEAIVRVWPPDRIGGV